VFPHSYSIRPKLPPAVKWLLLVNVACFLVARLSGSISFDYIFGLTIPEAFSSFRIYQFITYLFVHADLFHLLFNMLILYIFGPELENFWGRSSFLRYYFISGIGAGICSIPFIWGIQAPLIGASGALFALLIAYGMLFPDKVITLLLFFIIPVRMKARQMVLIFIALELLFLFNSAGEGGIAHFAHLGGALVGFIYLKWPIILNRLRNLAGEKDSQSIGARVHYTDPAKGNTEKDLQEDLNRILDKLAQGGWENLSYEEKEFLHDAGNKL